MLNSILALVAASSFGFGQPANFQPPVAWWEILRYALPPGKPAQHTSSRIKKRDPATRQKKDSYKGKGVNDPAAF